MEIVYADPRIVVAVKPAGVLSTDEPGGMPSCCGRSWGPPASARYTGWTPPSAG